MPLRPYSGGGLYVTHLLQVSLMCEECEHLGDHLIYRTSCQDALRKETELLNFPQTNAALRIEPVAAVSIIAALLIKKARTD